MALTTALGALLAAGKKKRMLVFSELYEFNEQLILNLKFNRYPVQKVAESFKYVPQILKGDEVLKGKDGEAIREYAVNLGKTDAQSQVDYLNERRSSLSKLKEECALEYKKYSSLYLKIFFMVGILMAVLLA